ncbi:MAG: hypothetical protein KKB31_02580 [Nanoarchaeota archaeon]|nr:hypothetical protein [Nanoarchaeota archaeon]
MVDSISDIIERISPYYAELAKKGKGGPDSEHTLVYDSSSETLEPVYFFIVDLMEEFGMAPEKLIDNFSSSAGSGHFSEMGGKASIMQQSATQTLGQMNTVLKSILNIIYDLRDFKIRLQTYDDLKDSSKKDAAILSLKQLWMDKVDLAAKGNSSIKAMALSQAGFQTLIDAFLVAKDTKDVQKLDLNDRVKRILTPRIAEFNSWVQQSERELKRRYAMERSYLKSQVSSLKLYTRWAKPYLKAASELETKDFGRDPALVKVFNTLLLELTLLGRQELRIKETALEGDLPKDFTKESFIRTLKRKYYGVMLVDFRFRGIPQKVPGTQHYTFGGKVDVTFKAYTLNEEEIAKLYQELDKSDLTDAFTLIEGSVGESMDQLQEDINFFLDEQEEEEQKTVSKDSSNPFLALMGSYDKSTGPSKKKKSKDEEIIVAKENWVEKTHLRPVASAKIVDMMFKFFDVYKKAHGMASYT